MAIVTPSSLFYRVDRWAISSPNKTAIYCPGGPSLSFSEATNQARELQKVLSEFATQESTDIVLLRLHRDAGAIVAILGVFAANLSFTPIDPEHPLERQQLIARECGAVVAVLSVEESEDFQTFLDAGLALVVVIDARGHIVDIRRRERQPPLRPNKHDDDQQQPKGLAYTMFTSGRFVVC